MLSTYASGVNVIYIVILGLDVLMIMTTKFYENCNFYVFAV